MILSWENRHLANSIIVTRKYFKQPYMQRGPAQLMQKIDRRCLLFPYLLHEPTTNTV